ncbi:MAG: TIGR01777 family protein [Desulfobulbaceae bacterium]|nr:MAG: TIGR01777 family protein [Desulfobulbaceae bacterium]
MNILLTGTTGFIGSALIPHLLAAGHQLKVLVRNPQKAAILPREVGIVMGDPTQPGPWRQEVAAAQAIINLTGASILTRWSPAAKQSIQTSRIIATRLLVDAMLSATGSGPKTLINASAAGYYGLKDDTDKEEDAEAGDDFLAQVCVNWEREAFKAKQHGHRVVTTRLGVVLGRGGGALAKMLPAFRWGLGGRIGSGRQPFPWIHLDDLTAIFAFLLKHPEIAGPVNCAAPQAINNKEFTLAMGQALRRPTVLPVPDFILRLLLGEMSTVLLNGVNIIPAVLKKHGFIFTFPRIDQALDHLMTASRFMVEK